MLNPKIKIAIAGVGTVGKGLIDLLLKYKNKQTKIEITAIASRRKQEFKGEIFKNTVFFCDAKNLLKFHNYDILVELIGGEKGVSKDIVFNALREKKNVVTANKALVSKFWNQLHLLAEKNNCSLKYEAAVAGGIPIIKIIDEFLLSNKITKIYGILNGTSNYILSNMLLYNKDFKNILSEAQKLGYAESNPKFDIDGTDTAHKLSILSSLAFECYSNVSKIDNEGIENVDLQDLEIADSLGYKIKLLGITELKNKNIKNFVYPCLLSKDSFIAKIDGVYNGIVVESNFCKKSCFVGEGAGAHPTATSVMSDIISLSKKRKNRFKQSPTFPHQETSLQSRFGSYYLRFTTYDKPGVISGIANQFKTFNISMKSMLQKETKISNSKDATIVITTHNCYENNMMKALKKINRLNFIRKKTVYFRIENFK